MVFYLTAILLLHIPAMQRTFAEWVSRALSQHLDTEVSIGRINPGLLNRVIIDDILIFDRQGEEMIRAPRGTAKFQWAPLFEGKVIVNSVQLFGARIHLYRKRPDEAPNYRFLTEAFASNDTTPSRLHLRINTILIRRGELTHHLHYEPATPGRFNPAHLHVSDFNVTASLRQFSPDSLNVTVKRFSFKEHSGAELKELSFKLTANSQGARLTDFALALPHSRLEIPFITADFDGLPTATPMSRWLPTLQYEGVLGPSRLLPADLSAFVPALKHFNAPLFCQARFVGAPHSTLLQDLRIYNQAQDISLKADGRLSFWDEQRFALSASAHIEDFVWKVSAHEFLAKNLSTDAFSLPPILVQLGDLDFQGRIGYENGSAEADGVLRTTPGALALSGTFAGGSDLKASLKGEKFRLDRLLSPPMTQSPFGALTFAVNLSGKLQKGQHPDLRAEAQISEFTYKNYPYQGVSAQLHYQGKSVGGTLHMNDPNGKINLTGELVFPLSSPFLQVTADIQRLSPHHLNFTTGYEDTRFSGTVSMGYQGDFPENGTARLLLSELQMHTPEGEYQINDISFESRPQNGEKHLRLTSDFVNAQVDGRFRFATLSNTLQGLLQRHLPSAFPTPASAKSLVGDELSFQVDINNVEPLQKVTGMPLYVPLPASLKGSLNGTTGQVNLSALIPELEYDTELLKDIELQCRNEGDSLTSHLSLQRRMGDAMVSLDLQAIAGSDLLHTMLSWDNNRPTQMKGAFSAHTHFAHHAPGRMLCNTRINPTQIVVNDTLWDIHSGAVNLINYEQVKVDSIHISQADRHLTVHGIASTQESDSVTVTLKDINVKYVLDLLNFDAVEFGGEASGKAYLCRPFNALDVKADLLIRNFTFNKGHMGDMSVQGGWDNEEKHIFLSALMKDSLARHTTRVNGTITPGRGEKGGLNLDIDTKRINLYFLNQYTDGLFSNVQGRASGRALLFGPFKRLDLTGDLLIEEARLKVDALNCHYHLQGDSVHMTPGKFSLPAGRVYDFRGGPNHHDHYADVSGSLKHEGFSDMNYKFDFQARNLLCYDFKDFGDEVFYGTVYGTGPVTLDGEPGRLTLNVNLTPEKNTTFTYNGSSPETLIDNRFITFYSAREEAAKRHTGAGYIAAEEPLQYIPESDTYLNFDLHITPDATINVQMDAKSGDQITLYGSGNLHAEYYNKGNFTMRGTYGVEYGRYNLSLQNVIRKDFLFRPGGTIMFDGAPFDGELNLLAAYSIPSVSLYDLSPNSTFSKSNVQVNCLINIGGKVEKPDIKFDFEIPNVNEDEQQRVRALITEEEKNMQIIYLLGIGRFYTYDYNNPDQSQSDVAMRSLLSSTMSGQLNHTLANIIGNHNWNIGTSFNPGQTGGNDMDVSGLLSGRLLNNRLLINGNFGYRENQMNNSNFVGDFDLQWLLRPNGNVSLKAYSETNDRYFTKSTLTTQGLGFMFKKDFNNWTEFFRSNRHNSSEESTPSERR